MKNYLLVSALLILIGTSCQTNSVKNNNVARENINTRFDKQDSIFAQAISETHDDTIRSEKDFGQGLIAFLEENPTSIAFDFPKLVEAGMHIATSSDNVLRIFSWDDNEGGSMRFFNNIFQVNLPKKQTLSLKSTEEDRTYFPFYNRIENIQLDGQTYYLAFARSVLSNREVDYAIELFTIKNNQLEPAFLFKSDLGEECMLHETFNYHNLESTETELFKLDTTNLTISVPIITEDGEITKENKTYQYKDKFFQRK